MHLKRAHSATVLPPEQRDMSCVSVKGATSENGHSPKHLIDCTFEH
jgi:hypothetical protein